MMLVAKPVYSYMKNKRMPTSLQLRVYQTVKYYEGLSLSCRSCVLTSSALPLLMNTFLCRSSN